MPIISVIIPVYRVEEYIENGIKSLISQTYKDYEILLIDNNSDDKSIPKAIKLLQDANIDFRIICESKQGVACAKNAGIRNALGEWIICVDPDDIMAPDFLEILYENAIREMVDVSFANYQIVNHNNLFKSHEQRIATRIISQREIINLFLCRKINIIVPGMLIRREFYVSNPESWNNESMLTGEDAYHLWIVLTRKNKFAYCDTPLYNYFVRPGSLTTNFNINKSLSCHEGFKQLKHYVSPILGEKMADQIVVRNDFALVRVVAKFSSYKDYLTIRNNLCNWAYYKKSKNFPDIRVILLNFINKHLPRLFYIISHR